MKLVIDRQKWGTGRLLRTASKWLLANPLGIKDPDEGKMCCLGFYCRLLGIPESKMDYGMPTSIAGSERSLLPRWLWEEDSGTLAAINDRGCAYSRLSDSQREAAIAEIFARHDVQVEFIN